MTEKYDFETTKCKVKYINIEQYLYYYKKLLNMFKYNKINKKLFEDCHLDAYVKMQRFYFER